MHVRHAADVFDEERMDLASKLFDGLAKDPWNNLRKLKKMPEGVDLLIRSWQELRAYLGLDPAPVYRLALEKGTPGARYHAVAEEGVSAPVIAEAIGRGLNIPVVSLTPEEAAEHFGWFAFFAGLDILASSALTRERLGWHPTQTAGLIEDLDNMDWSAL